MRKAYTIDEIRKIIKLRMAGWRPDEIASMVGRTRRTIDRLLSQQKHMHNYEYPKLTYSGTKWTPNKIEKIAKQCPKHPYRVIAKQNGVSAARIYYLMAKRAHAIRAGVWVV